MVYPYLWKHFFDISPSTSKKPAYQVHMETKSSVLRKQTLPCYFGWHATLQPGKLSFNKLPNLIDLIYGGPKLDKMEGG